MCIYYYLLVENTVFIELFIMLNNEHFFTLIRDHSLLRRYNTCGDNVSRKGPSCKVSYYWVVGVAQYRK